MRAGAERDERLDLDAIQQSSEVVFSEGEGLAEVLDLGVI